MTDPYSTGLVTKNPFHARLPVSGAMVAILNLRHDRRSMKLMVQRSRALLKNEIHELMLTNETASCGDVVEQMYGLGFFEVTAGGVVLRGDTLRIGDRVIGTVAGFNGDHMPNHLNIVVAGTAAGTGATLGLALQESMVIGKL